MYKFKIYIILILIIILFFLYIYNKEYFTLENDKIFVNDDENILTEDYLIVIEYNNNCSISKEFMYGCCDIDATNGEGVKVTDTFKSYADSNKNPL